MWFDIGQPGRQWWKPPFCSGLFLWQSFKFHFWLLRSKNPLRNPWPYREPHCIPERVRTRPRHVHGCFLHGPVHSPSLQKELLTEWARIKNCSSNQLIHHSFSSLRALDGGGKCWSRQPSLWKFVLKEAGREAALPLKGCFAVPGYQYEICTAASPVTHFSFPYIGMDLLLCSN